MLAAILGFFLAGGIGGAAAFKAIGYAAVLPIVAVLVAISALHLVANAKLLLKLAAGQQGRHCRLLVDPSKGVN
ncbi:hypothetical protein GCM10011496_17070 [Polaromonas eurypsychrophila]|uniref:Uncharacterized protein n=1 Tax=Polaromonas eurypsychrophila TaxID=1614635 RepID=A0A916WH50_9BURK|nr:hypothetical protein GCM10011496_17070 [Polaromonas eurypsychrophila]